MLCLHALDRAGASTAGALSSQLGRTTGAVTHMIDRLEKAGYVRRKPDPQDRRRVLVEASASGLERIASLYGYRCPQSPDDGHPFSQPTGDDPELPSEQLRRRHRRVRTLDPAAG
nr:MarR family transcriptional regulator [Nonomuraea jiangxiensis]